MTLQNTKKSSKGYKGGKAKTVYAHMGIWRQKDQIHLTIPKENYFHTTVNSKSGSIRCHKNLYKKLKILLEREGCWE